MKIDIRPSTALTILAFLRELIPANKDVEQQLIHMKSCVDDFHDAIGESMTDDEANEAIAEIHIQALINNSPPLR